MEKLIIRLVEELKNEVDGLTYHEIVDRVGLDVSERAFVKLQLQNALENAAVYRDTIVFEKDTIFCICSEGRVNPNIDLEGAEEKFRIKTELFFSYLDYLELQQARKNAQTSFWTAMIAIIISLISLVINILFNYNNSKQLQELYSVDLKGQKELIQGVDNSNLILDSLREKVTNHFSEASTSSERVGK
ncbi:hypothetical protein GF380_04895 [Candidatus Uhrbacteria bacterium]|nr:hypothetical protein [Candidatus Uhrbacteria bacterium]